ncbi:MAG: glutaredoxin domain-containing protein [Desulfuromonadales bacterium]
MSRLVEIYTRSHCVYCQRAKDLLRIKGIDFVEHDITDNPHKTAEMQQRSPQQEAPGIFIDGQAIGGCRELFDLDEQGLLDQLLGLFPFPGGSLQSV